MQAVLRPATSIFARLSRNPAVWFLLALSVYAAAAGLMWDQQSLAPHYIHLADSMLHGRLDLMHTDNLYDLLLTDGRAYVAGSPMPAILLLPVVALFNNQFSDVLFSIVLAALNVALVQAIFGRRWLTILFAFGTPHLALGGLGTVWLAAHVVAILFGLLAVWAALHRRWFWAGLALSAAGLARPTLLFGSVFFILLIWLTLTQWSRWRALAYFGIPLLLGVLAHGLYNQARFGSPLEFGYRYTAGADNLISTFARYSGFSPRFLPCNLYVSFLNPPEVGDYIPDTLYWACDHLINGQDLATGARFAPNPIGMSIFLTTPAFFLLLMARKREPLTLAAWAGLLAVMLPLWMYHNTGSLQFGFRYWLDAAPFWLLLLARNVRRPEPGTSRVDYFLWQTRIPLLAASVLINMWGYYWWYEKYVGVTWLALLRGIPRY